VNDPFAGWVRRRRHELALTQDGLADRAGVSVRTIRNLESGRGTNPAPHTRGAVIAVLGRPPSSTPETPAQLPADISVFLGREDELRELHSRMVQPNSAPLIIVVSGPAGVGKTALTVRLAHRLRDQFADGQIYVDLRGYDPDRPMSQEDALVSLLEALGVPPQEIPLDAGARTAAYRSALAGRRVLIGLDNAASPDQVRMLLPGSPSCATLITSRDPLSGLVAGEGAIRTQLAPLATESSVALLATLIGTRAKSEPEATATLANAALACRWL
jgi:transcriptional regulator with XRE-family HTH domain